MRFFRFLVGWWGAHQPVPYDGPEVWISATLSAPTIIGVLSAATLSATLVDTTILATLETVSVEGML
jgi:hypothetical protein